MQRLHDFWVDHPIWFDVIVSTIVWCLTAAAILIAGDAYWKGRDLAPFFSALATATGALLAVVVGILTFIVGSMPHLIGPLNSVQLKKLVNAFHRTIGWTSIVFVLSLVAVMVQEQWFFAAICFLTAYVVSTAARTIYLLNKVNMGMIKTFIDEKVKEEEEEGREDKPLIVPPPKYASTAMDAAVAEKPDEGHPKQPDRPD